MTELTELLLNSENISIPQIECLIKFSKQTNPKKFGKAIRAIPCDIGKQLLKFCQTKFELLQELIILLSYNEDEAANLFEEVVDDIQGQAANEINDDKDAAAKIEITGDQLLCCHLLDTRQFTGSQKLMKKLTLASRTWYLCKIL